jgi:hypothetical protein
MINRSPQLSALRSGLLIENKRLNAYFSIAIILLAGCSATQVRWDATKMRKDVMVYYNDQIMDNLIRAKNRLPFVHVDITLLTSQGGSQISGTIGAGENRTNTNTSKSTVMGALGTVANAVSRPFGWSVTPQQTETLTISTAPALGPQAVAAPEQATSKKPPMQITKWTDAWEITYPTPSPSPAPPPPETVKGTRTSEWATTQSTIYDLYEDFADCYVKQSPTRPSPDECVPGTLKRVGTEYYYVPVGTWRCSDCPERAKKEKDNQMAYYKFCKALFTKGQAGLLGSAVQQNLAAPLAVPSR